MLSPQLRARQRLKASALRAGRPLVGGGLARIWWIVLLRAAASMIFGGLALAWPHLAAVTLMTLFSAFVLVDGLMAFVASARSGGLRARWWLALSAAASILAGVFVLTEPRMAALLLIVIFGAWLIVYGLASVIGAIATRVETKGDWSLPVDGLMSALFGAGLIAAPRIGALGLVWAIGAWAIFHGLLMVPFALRLRRARLAISERGVTPS